MARRPSANDFYFFVGTLFFGLFALLLASGRSAGADVAASAIRIGLSGVLLVLSFYVLQAGVRAQRAANRVQMAVVVIPPHVVSTRRNSRVA